jgi:hypothetical protein
MTVSYCVLIYTIFSNAAMLLTFKLKPFFVSMVICVTKTVNNLLIVCWVSVLCVFPRPFLPKVFFDHGN